jgi:TP901 family phage tail tape measure protein|tara:strand:+ start:13713 stop:16013 length:2301 start_codon:yes stop_codon:yes gene_type:complete
MAAGGPAKLTLKIGADLGASFKKSIRQAQKQLSTFNQNVKRSINDAATGASRGFKNVIRNDAFQASAVAAAGLGTVLTGAVRTAMDFEKSMNAVAAVSGATGQDFKSLTNLAKQLGRTTQFSASEAAGAMEMLSMAGLNTQQMLAATGPTLNLAAAGGIELAEAADIATNIMGGMALKVGDLNTINDVLAKTSSSANTNVTEMAAVFEKVGGVAPTMGASLQQVSGMAGILANNGIKAAEAGTALRNVMLRMASEDTAKKALKNLGVSATDAAGDMREFPDILADMEKRMTALGLSESARADIQKKVFGLRAVAAGSILQQAAANGELDTMIQKVTDSEGAAAKQAKTRQKGLAGTMKRLNSALEGLALAFGGPLLTPIAMAAEALAGLAGPIAWLFDNVPGLGLVVGGLSAAFIGIVVALPILAALKGAILGLTGAATVMAGIKAIALGMVAPLKFVAFGFLKMAGAAVVAGIKMAIAFAPVILPILAVAAAIAAVIGIGHLLVKFWPQISEAASTAFNAVVNFLKELGAKIFGAIKGIIKKLFAIPKAIAKVVIKMLAAFIKGFAAMGKAAAKGVAQLVMAYFQLPLTVAKVVSQIIAHFTGIDLFEAGSNLLTSMWEGFKNIWPRFKDWLVESFKNALAGIAATFDPRNLWPWGKDEGNGEQVTTPRQKRARGGPVFAGGSYLVGERGPELFTPGRGGNILSTGDTMAALGGGGGSTVSLAPTINITVTESNASADDIAAAVARGLDDALMEAEAGMRALLND